MGVQTYFDKRNIFDIWIVNFAWSISRFWTPSLICIQNKLLKAVRFRTCSELLKSLYKGNTFIISWYKNGKWELNCPQTCYITKISSGIGCFKTWVIWLSLSWNIYWWTFFLLFCHNVKPVFREFQKVVLKDVLYSQVIFFLKSVSGTGKIWSLKQGGLWLQLVNTAGWTVLVNVIHASIYFQTVPYQEKNSCTHISRIKILV